MKEYALELVASQTGVNAKLNIMREYLQAYILRIMHDAGAFRSTAFLGGTALRFLYQLPRFSEDLDFSLTESSRYSFSDLIVKIKQELTLAGYDVSISYNDKKTVQHAFVKFEKLMHEGGISPYSNKIFSIKIEFDTNPPKGARFKTDVVNKYFPISFLSHDIPSLFAGKCHALLSRKYAKGRDFFDLGWYLSRWSDITPNISFLRNALRQTGFDQDAPLKNNWRDYIYNVIDKANWKTVHQDVVNFLENPSDMDIFSKENLLKLVGRRT